MTPGKGDLYWVREKSRVGIREVSQIENVDADVNIDAESHPVGHSTPWILLFISSELNRLLGF